MQQSAHLGYGEGQGYRLVESPYAGGEMSMVVMLPAEGQFEAFAQGLDAQELAATLEGIEPARVTLALPRFESEASLRVSQAGR